MHLRKERMCKTYQWSSLKAISDPKDNKIKIVAIRSDNKICYISRKFQDNEPTTGIISTIVNMINLLELERNKKEASNT